MRKRRRLIFVSVDPVYEKKNSKRQFFLYTFNLYNPMRGVISQAGIRKCEVTVIILSKMAFSSS